MKRQPTGNEIIKLLGYSESSDEVLDLFEMLDIDKSEIDRDKDTGSFDVIIQEGKDEADGTAISFNPFLSEKNRKPQNIGGQYVTYIEFDYNFTPLPYDLNDEDSLEIIEKKLGKKVNYIDIEDSDILHWLYEDLGWISITFEDSSYTSIMMIQLNIYSDPTDKNEGYEEVIKPYSSRLLI